ncbi:FAD-binding and (Fe-S)-binding domain-containing protein [Rhizobium leguminosarum]|uniref:D-2-hydroxyglutarate dehydrogenase YdiJ n=1 Tax=Rhizobium leguminosarum TaxID=384 RepID=UPI001C9129DD|nr:FAD-binding and (Fe-S)-binding domain-containing protein [Rhizobium leguminosarum]MBY2909963.1 FAD-binding oxidoreductase [Rhizobium leguminosarum]
MIPRLVPNSQKAPLVNEYVLAVRKAGFGGDMSADTADKIVFATDNSIYEIAPKAVLFPRSLGDVSLALAVLAQPVFRNVKLAARGGGTGTNGQSLSDGVVLDLSRYLNCILEINADEGWVRVQAGVVKDQLNAALKTFGMFFAPELSTSNRATIGGMINTDASGQGSCLYGKTRDHVLELTSIFSDGTIWTSCALDDLQLAQAKRTTGIVGRLHKSVDCLQRENASAIQMQFPKLNRCLTGYDLAHIRDGDGRFDLNSVLCGSEGTLAVIAEAKLRILPIPKHTVLVNVRYESFDACLRDARSLITYGAASIETVDSKVLALAQDDIVWEGVKAFFPSSDGEPTHGVNLVEFVGGTVEEVERQLALLVATLEADGGGAGRLGFTIARGEASVQSIWQMRKRAVGLLGNMQGDKRPIAFVEDTAVPPENLADFIAEFRALLDRRGLDYGMFGHVDAGVLHVRPAIDLKAPEQEKLIRDITDEVVNLTLKYGGLLWGEHGKGVRSEYSPKFFGQLYPIVQAVKQVFDPHNQLNPGKIAAPSGQKLLKIDAVPMRGQADRKIPQGVRAVYTDVVNCNGNGACYDWDPDTAMCPSWKATREGRHSPKGRAMLTKEWLRRLAANGSNPLAEGNRLRSLVSLRDFPAKVLNSVFHGRRTADFSHDVKEAMDGCLACKSCVAGCPIKVNVPSFRARFLELYHSRYLRPPKDRLVAVLEGILPLLAKAPRLTNTVLRISPVTATLRALGLVDLPLLTGTDLSREMVARGFAFATPDALRSMSAEEKRRAVVVVQDAFTSFYETELVFDTLELLSGLGFKPFLTVYQPNGKPLHVHGFLKRFERIARAQAEQLKSCAAAGIPLVGIDPSMTLTFRSEYVDALGAGAVPRVHLLQEWLAARLPARFSAIEKNYVLLPHCTERATAASSLQDWVAIFSSFGLRLNVVASGCCGMAGTYGHETRNVATSRAIFDMSWRRHVEEARPEEEVLATGYSCRSQAKRFGKVRLRHPVQVLLEHLALTISGNEPAEVRHAS